MLARIQVLRRYRIQEVIRKRQILLVQVVKEERGTKGAALTTYISLAGRYCVLMPNTPRGGGISRKIADAGDRKRLKTIMSELSIDSRMGLILRTAGLAHSKAEIKRDFDYLTRLWDDIRERTLKSSAPCLIHEEGNLIKRAVRDLYTRDTQEILVEGEEAYKTAKDFMRMMMPSHAARVKQFTERVPLFQRFQVEAQLDALHRDTVPLRSGAYIVLNPTEALVAIDVNSGRATKERNIEETATKTNLEAADEIARQLRLRDLAGLIVIDFIDMNEAKNDRLVEKRLKEAVKTDRARIQLGRISPFGLLELSRQRLRPSLLEANTERCATCVGSGRIRSVESSALQALRAIESGALREEGQELSVTVPTKVAFYLLNQKRASLNLLEARYGLHITVHCDDTMVAPACRIERLRGAPTRRAEAEAEPAAPGAVERVEAEPAEEEPVAEVAEEPVAEVAEEPMAEVAEEPAPVGEEAPRRRRRRGRRGGRRHRREGEPAVGGESEAPAPGSAPEARPSGGDIDRPETEEPEGEEVGQSAAAPHRAGQPEGTASTTEGSLRRRRRRRRRGGQRPASEEGAASAAAEPTSISGAREPHGAATSQEPRPEIDAMPPRERASEVDEFAGATRGEPVLPALIGDNAAQPVEDLEASGTRARRPAKRGWWQRLQKGSTESD